MLKIRLIFTQPLCLMPARGTYFCVGKSKQKRVRGTRLSCSFSLISYILAFRYFSKRLLLYRSDCKDGDYPRHPRLWSHTWYFYLSLCPLALGETLTGFKSLAFVIGDLTTAYFRFDIKNNANQIPINEYI